MKRLLIIIDGMDDEPIPDLDNLTPAEYADMPSLSFMKIHGEVSFQKTIPKGYTASTEIALMTILGYVIGSDFNSRSWFEALGGGLQVNENDLCLRCNLISHENNILVSHCGHYPSREESYEIIRILNKHFGNKYFSFHSFGNFRNLLIIKNCEAEVMASEPHSIIGEALESLQIKSSDKCLEKRLNRFITESQICLKEHRANGISLWAPGKAISFSNKIKGTVISGVNVVKGICSALGMSITDVPGATGDEFTDYYAKLKAAIKALKNVDFVLLHIEAPDEASHERDWKKKVKILEKIDRLVLTPLLNNRIENLQITIQSDHATSSISGRHLNSPVTVINYFKPSHS